jgi:8-oxo-dGTP diphosphatase
MPKNPQVRAAGGVIVDRASGRFALVHRPRYDDWSFPKGKLEAGEEWEEAALREVLEETGLRCSLESELPNISYSDRKGRPKLVRYWRMRVLEGEFEPNDEVDELRWVEAEEALELLSYQRDRDLLAEFEA